MERRADLGRKADAYFDAVDPKLQPLTLAVRAVVLKAIPHATEVIKWGLPVYVLPGKKMWTCAIRAGKAYVTLQFGVSGTSLPDPKGLLEGTGKNLRHIKLRTVKDMPVKTIEAWLKWAAKAEA